MAVNPIRETLFGDMPLYAWAHGETSSSPWVEFHAAQQKLDVGDTAGATKHLHEIVGMHGLEPRHTLQAWTELRRLGVSPESDARQLLGVVIEVALDEGLDMLAAYVDHSARYINYSGAAVLWDHADPSLDDAIDELLDAARAILQQIGPWEGPRPPAPPTGQARISMLAPGGLFFGQAPLQTLMTDPLAAPAMNAALKLMQALIEKSEAARRAR